MGSINKVFLIGNLGDDPERVEKIGLTKFRMATSETWTKDGKKNQKTEWHQILVFKDTACFEFLKKRSQVHVEGRIQTREWEDKNGNKRYTTEIVANRVTFLDGPAKGRRTEVDQQAALHFDKNQGPQHAPLDDGDIPF